jgi:copper chaperone NosL
VRLAAGAALVLAAACGSRAPRPIALGSEICAHCHMTIADPRYTAELITRAGKVYVFDDIGCLAAFVRDSTVPPGQIAGLWVNDITAPGRWLEARSAAFLVRPDAHTPMNTGLMAFPGSRQADSARAAAGGELREWEAIVAGAASRHDHPL